LEFKTGIGKLGNQRTIFQISGISLKAFINNRNGYSFLNSILKDKGNSLLNEFLENQITKSFFTRGFNNDQIDWNMKNCLSWLKKSKELLEILMVLSHLLGGQPARSTEMATMRWINGSQQQRGVYWVNNTMMLLGIYAKTRGMTGQDKLIPRYNPKYIKS
jgi:hypothetical protein